MFGVPSVVGVWAVDKTKTDREQLGRDTFIIGHDQGAVCSTRARSQYACSFREFLFAVGHPGMSTQIIGVAIKAIFLELP